jgi:hypothetical protein
LFSSTHSISLGLISIGALGQYTSLSTSFVETFVSTQIVPASLIPAVKGETSHVAASVASLLLLIQDVIADCLF